MTLSCNKAAKERDSDNVLHVPHDSVREIFYEQKI